MKVNTQKKLGAHKDQETSQSNNDECTACDKSFDSSEATDTHRLSHTCILAYFCMFCPEMFQSEEGLRMHCQKQHQKHKDLLTESDENEDVSEMQEDLGDHSKESEGHPMETINIADVSSDVHLRNCAEETKTKKGTKRKCSDNKKETHTKRRRPDSDIRTQNSQIAEGSVMEAPKKLKGARGRQTRKNELVKSKKIKGTKESADQTVNNDNKIKCRYCDTYFRQRHNCVAHERNHELKEKPFKCEKCSSSFARGATWRSHYRKVHLLEPPPTPKRVRNQKPKETAFMCEYCSRMFKRPEGLRLHKRIHTNEKPFSCKYCQKDFYRKVTKKRHEEKHEEKNMCLVCHKNLGSAFSLQIHMQCHNKHHMCDHCGLNCSSAFYLRRHLQTHKSGDDAHPQKSVSSKESLNSSRSETDMKAHKVKHSRKKTHTCEFCSKGFARANALKEHRLIHTVGVLHECDVCTASLRTRKSFRYHVRNKHPDLAETMIRKWAKGLSEVESLMNKACNIVSSSDPMKLAEISAEKRHLRRVTGGENERGDSSKESKEMKQYVSEYKKQKMDKPVQQQSSKSVVLVKETTEAGETSETIENEETKGQQTRETTEKEETNKMIGEKETWETAEKEETSRTIKNKETWETTEREETNKIIDEEETNETSDEETNETMDKEESSNSIEEEETSETSSRSEKMTQQNAMKPLEKPRVQLQGTAEQAEIAGICTCSRIKMTQQKPLQSLRKPDVHLLKVASQGSKIIEKAKAGAIKVSDSVKLASDQSYIITVVQAKPLVKHPNKLFNYTRQSKRSQVVQSLPYKFGNGVPRNEMQKLLDFRPELEKIDHGQITEVSLGEEHFKVVEEVTQDELLNAVDSNANKRHSTLYPTRTRGPTLERVFETGDRRLPEVQSSSKLIETRHAESLKFKRTANIPVIFQQSEDVVVEKEALVDHQYVAYDLMRDSEIPVFDNPGTEDTDVVGSNLTICTSGEEEIVGPEQDCVVID